MAKNFVRIDGWPVAPAVARDYVKLRDAHNSAFPNEPLIINSGYRTRSEQAAIFTSRYTRGAYSPYGDYRTYQGATWGRTSGLGPVASPDVGSNHTRGYALDLNLPQAGSARHNWFLANASRFNFNWIEGRSIGEWWHVCWHVGIFPDASTPDPWEGRGAPDPVYPSDPGMPLGGSGAGGGSTTDNTLSEEDEIMRIKNVDTGRIYNVGMGSIVHVNGGDGENKAWDDAGLPGYTEVKEWSFQRIIRQMGIPKGVVNAKGSIRNDREGQGKYESNGSWFASDKAERFAYLAQK